jgi:hypothetical protein
VNVEEKQYRPHASAVPFHESRAEVKALCGPVGSGKSSAACVEVFFLCRESPVPVRALVMRESYRQLHDSTRRTWMEWFGGCSQYLKSEETVKFTIPGVDGIERTHEIHFRHARRAEEVSNFLSTEYGLIWLEEPVPAYDVERGIIGGGMPEDVFTIVATRLRQSGVHRRHVLLTFNPPNTHHWVYKTFFKPSSEELRRKDYALFRQPAFENAAHLPDRYYEKMLERLSPEMADRFVRGEPVTIYPGVKVFPEFQEQIHLGECLMPSRALPLVISFDFGLTPVAVIAQVHPAGRVEIYREVQMWNAGVQKLGEELTRVLRDEFPGFEKWRCWGDPAGAARSQTDEKTCFDVLGAMGFHVQPGAVDWQSRKEAVKQRLERMIDGKPGVLIDRQRCPILSEGMLGAYRYPKATDGRIGQRPIKNDFSHVADALQYMLTGEFSVTGGEAYAKTREIKIPRFDPFSEPSRGSLTWMGR